MDARIFFLLIAAVMIAGFVAETYFGRDLHNWDEPSTRVASDRVLLKLGEPAARRRIDEAVSGFEDAAPPEDHSSDDSE